MLALFLPSAVKALGLYIGALARRGEIDLRILLVISLCRTFCLTYSVKQPIIQTFFIDLAVSQRHTCHLALWRNQ